MPPAWDSPKLLLVIVSGLHIVVGTSTVVGVIVDGGVWLLDSNLWSQQSDIERGKGEQSNREYSSKVLASKDLHYICIGIKWKRGSIRELNCRMPE